MLDFSILENWPVAATCGWLISDTRGYRITYTKYYLYVPSEFVMFYTKVPCPCTREFSVGSNFRPIRNALRITGSPVFGKTNDGDGGDDAKSPTLATAQPLILSSGMGSFVCTSDDIILSLF